MQPDPITSGQWNDIAGLLLWLWVAVGCVVVAAGCLLAGYALAPSLRASGLLPGWARTARGPTLVVAFLALAAAIAAGAIAVERAGVLYDIYGKVWI